MGTGKIEIFLQSFMETNYGSIYAPDGSSSHHRKSNCMLTRSTLNRIIIIGFMVLVGFCLAKAIYSGSFIGICLALTSLGAGIYFLYLLVKAKEAMESEENSVGSR